MRQPLTLLTVLKRFLEDLKHRLSRNASFDYQPTLPVGSDPLTPGSDCLMSRPAQ